MRSRLQALVVLVWLVGCRPAAGPAPPTQAEIERFRDAVVEVLRAEYPKRQFELAGDPWIITSASTQLGLQNLYARCQQGAPGPAEQRSIIKAHFESVFAAEATLATQAPLPWEKARPLLRPQLVPAEYFETVHGPHTALCDGVVEAYVIDADSSYQVVTDEDVTRWKVSIEALEEAAIGNLEAGSSGMKLSSQDGDDPFIIVALGDGYDAARILLPGFRRYAAQRLGEPFLAGIPNRDFLIAWSLGGSPEFQGRTRRAIVEDFSSQPHPLTQAVLRVTVTGITVVD
jgi:hypothetical protein